MYLFRDVFFKDGNYAQYSGHFCTISRSGPEVCRFGIAEDKVSPVISRLDFFDTVLFSDSPTYPSSFQAFQGDAQDFYEKKRVNRLRSLKGVITSP